MVLEPLEDDLIPNGVRFTELVRFECLTGKKLNAASLSSTPSKVYNTEVAFSKYEHDL